MSPPARLLALDCAGAACSAAVWCDGALSAARHAVMARGQSERLVPMVETVMAESGLGYEALDAIAVTCGPGGFTGVRIGLATARGLALASGRPLLGFSNFAVLAAAVSEPERSGRALAVTIDAKRADLYVEARDAAGTVLLEATALLPEDLDAGLPDGPLLLAGDAAETARAALEASGREVAVAGNAHHADAAVLARLAAGVEPDGSHAPRPIYLRPPDVSRPKPLRP